MKFIRLLLLLLTTVAMGQYVQPPPTAPPVVAMAGMSPNGFFADFALDNNGNLYTTGNTHLFQIGGYIGPVAVVAQTPSGTWGYLNLDASGNLKVTGSGGGSITLTTSGTSGLATYVGGILNIPNYASGGSMTWPSGSAGIPNYNGSSAWGTTYNASNTIPANFISSLSYVATVAGDGTIFSSTPVGPGAIALTLINAPTGSGPVVLSTGPTIASPTITGNMTISGSVSVGGSAPTCGTGVTGCVPMGEASTPLVPATSVDMCQAFSTSHGYVCSLNGGTAFNSAMNLPEPTNPSPGSPVTQMVYNTPSSGTLTNIGATNMVATTSAQHDYLFNWTIDLTTTGLSCTGNTTVTLNVIFTDPNTSTPVTQALGTVTLANGTSGTVGFIAEGTENVLAKTGTAVQYSTTNYTGGSGCITNPSYTVYPTLVQLW
jgi:hypothetical protein